MEHEELNTGHGAELDTEAVLDWLRAHPDLFRAHPELLECFEFEHGAGASSLIERQVQRLREENCQHKAQLANLIGIAGENQRLVLRLHRLTLDLMSTGDTARFIVDLAGRLQADFRSETVVLHLDGPDLDLNPELGGLEHVRRLPATPPDWMQKMVADRQPLCGRLTRAKIEAMFGEQAERIASCALVPLESGGVLAIGSSDPERYFADMGTLFLELLGATVDFRLRQLTTDERKTHETAHGHREVS